MSIFKIEKTKDYTVMSNYHLRDKNLSYKAKGLLSFMLSLPEDWDYSMKGLESISKESIKAIRNILQELEDNKYLIRTRKQDNMGKFYYDYSIYEMPFDINPYYQKGHAVKGHAEKGIQINTNKQNTNKQIDKDDKTILNNLNHHYLTNELIKNKYITCDDSQVFYYDKLFEQLIDDGNDFGDLITIIHYIIPRVLKRDFKDEDGNEIENKFGYFKNSMISNINKLKNPVDNLWDEEEYDYLDDDLER
mgnify:CR=1 FL=1